VADGFSSRALRKCDLVSDVRVHLNRARAHKTKN
jgi:hypothetical protein